MRLILSPKKRRAEEAAAWYARLNASVVPHADLEAFRRWRLKPGADAAYAKVETTWRRFAPLRADPQVNAWMKAPPRRPGPVGKGRAPLVIGVGAAGALAAGAAFVWIADLSAGSRYATPVAGRDAVTLADGSRLILDADTRLRMRLDARSRRLRLDRGRVLVDVAHDPSRPFVVDAGNAQVTALGTRFTVRRDSLTTKVVLLRGAVEVRERHAAAGRWTLSPGQALDSRRRTLEPADLSSALGWTQGRIILQAASPADAVAEINRYAAHPVRLAPGLERTAPVSGVFRQGDPDAFASALTRVRGWRATRQPDGGLLLDDRAPPPTR